MSSIAVSILSWPAFDALLRGRMIANERVRLMLSWIAWQGLCAAVFGLSLGVYSISSRAEPDYRFMLADVVKMPMLLFLTSAVTCPSLYVFGALRGLRFSAREFAAMLMVAHTILAAVLGSLAPVIAFFAVTTTSYSFMVVLTVVACAIAGILGVRTFIKAINEPPDDVQSSPVADTNGETNSTESPGMFSRPAHVNQNIWRMLGWWVVLYVFVGAQMGWILRPFIGSPELPFIFFRGKGGSMIESLLYHLHKLFGA
ncbi:MAG TPA: hypothetical protein VEK08_22000 [Planctomycetota bacterium]|nr:hypothetical protein [Planctomycetota bacterium]